MNVRSSGEDDASSVQDEKVLIAPTLIDFNTVLQEIGDLGRYQMFLVSIAYFIAISSGLNMVGSVFLEATPDHWCALPPLDNHPNQYPNLSINQLKKYTIPYDNKTDAYDQCHRYNYSLTSCTPGKLDCITPYPPTPPQVIAIRCDKGYRYNNSVYNSTVATEWNLVCSRAILKSVADSVFFVGVLIGAVVGGNFADLYGRVPAMIISQVGIVAFGVGCSYAPTLPAYIILRFVLAMFVQIGCLSGFVYAMEIIGDKWRTCIGLNAQTMFTVGELMLSLFAYIWRDWRSLQFYMSLFPLLFCLLAVFLPESPRWLFSKGKYEKGKRICEIMTKRNGRTLSCDIWERAEEAGLELVKEIELDNHYTFVELFKRPLMRNLTIEMIFLWFVASLVYYGLALNVATLSGNVYLNNTLNALVEPVAYLIIILTMDRVGRRPITFVTFLVGGIGCLLSTYVNSFAKHTKGLTDFVTAMGILGKMAIAGAFGIIYNYNSELYPTVIRSTAVGTGAIGARVGGVITPWALYLQNIVPWLTGTIFGVGSILAALLVLRLPETLNQPMMTTLDEAEEFYGRKRNTSHNEHSVT